MTGRPAAAQHLRDLGFDPRALATRTAGFPHLGRARRVAEALRLHGPK